MENKCNLLVLPASGKVRVWKEVRFDHDESVDNAARGGDKKCV